MSKDNTCDCVCHRDGMDITHFMPCCAYTGEKYINENGFIDKERLNKIKNEGTKNNGRS